MIDSDVMIMIDKRFIELKCRFMIREICFQLCSINKFLIQYSDSTLGLVEHRYIQAIDMIRFGLLITLAAVATAQTSTAKPGRGYGESCNGVLSKCNPYNRTVNCISKKNVDTTTPLPTSEDRVLSLIRGGSKLKEQTCEMGMTVHVGRCECVRNCPLGIFVETGEFDADREICVGLVGSSCAMAVPECTKNAKCESLESTCTCDPGFVADATRRCVPE